MATGSFHFCVRKLTMEMLLRLAGWITGLLFYSYFSCPRIAKLCSSVMVLKHLQLSFQETAVQITNPIWKTFIVSITTHSSRSLKTQHKYRRKTLHKSNLELNILNFICKEWFSCNSEPCPNLLNPTFSGKGSNSIWYLW